MIDKRFYQSTKSFTLQDIIAITDATCETDASISSFVIDDIAPLDTANHTQLSCFHNAKYLSQLQQTHAGACFVTPNDLSSVPDYVIPLITPQPYRCFGLIAQTMYPNVDRIFEYMTKPIHPTAHIGDDCIIEYGCVIHADAKIGNGTRIGANTVIGPGVFIGDNCIIESNVAVKYTLIGNNVTILSGTCIGQAGFGFFMDEKGHIKMPQLGRVIIADNVEIGANVTIDRGSLKDTIINEGCRIDNLVQIAHNVILGKGCVIVAQVGIAGSTIFGDHVIAAGQAGIAGHLKIGNRVVIAAQTGIMRDVEDHAVVAGSPAVPVKQWHRQTVVLKKLTKLKGSEGNVRN